MASAKTHFSAAIIISGFGATSLLAANLTKPAEALFCLAAGIIGGCLPDVDADNSRPLKLTFHALAICAAFFAMFLKANAYSVAELAGMWLFTYLAVRVGAVKLFEKITVHRGLFHSVPTGLLFALLTSNICFHFFRTGAVQSLTMATFVFVGYISHLLLDEITALNLFGVGAKRSLGSALKLYRSKNAAGTAAIYLAVIFLFMVGPNWKEFSTLAFSASTFQAINKAPATGSEWFADLRPSKLLKTQPWELKLSGCREQESKP